MAENDILFLYTEFCVLNVCIAPAEPFCTVPMIAASKQGERTIFGKKALEKDDSWQLIWLRKGSAQMKLFKAFFLFVFAKQEVKNAVKECKRILVSRETVLATDRRGLPRLQTSFYPTHFIPLSLHPLSTNEDELCFLGRVGMGFCFALNISADMTVFRYSDRFNGHSSSLSYIKVGFDTIVNLFIKLLCEKGYDFTATKERLFCQNLVLDYCYVALDFENELERIENLDEPLHEVTLADGSILELGKECIMATEVLFKPELVGKDEKSIMSLFQQYYFADWSNSPPVLLIGGCASSLKGLGERIQQELRHIDCINAPIQIIKTEIREDAAKAMEVKFGFK